MCFLTCFSEQFACEVAWIDCSSVQFSHSVVSSLWPHLSSMPGFPVHHQLPELAQTHVHQVSVPSNHLVFCCRLLLLPSIFPSMRVFSNESVLHIKWPKYWSFSLASVLPMNIQDWFPLELTGLISLQSKRLSVASPTPQFKGISSSVLRFLYGPTLTSIHDYWKNRSFD